MKFAVVALAIASVATAQVVYENGEYKCLGESAGKDFCAGTSLETNIIIRCTGEKGQPGNCNDNLAGVPPVGVKTFAPCYQSSNSAGDAACSYNGMAYPDSGEPYPIPGYPASSSSSYSSSAAPSVYEPPSSSSSSSSTSYSVTIYPTGSSTTTTETVYPTLPTDYPNVSTETVYPTATLSTVTGIVTVTTSETTSKIYISTGTGGPVPPSGNQTSYTTSFPVPTQLPSGAGSLLAKDGLVLGAIAMIGFLFL